MVATNPSHTQKASIEAIPIVEDAVDKIIKLTQGYPYFIQEWGYQSWNHAQNQHITLVDVDKATKMVTERLDKNFFRVRFDRMTPSEKKFIRAMAYLGSKAQKSGDIASVLGVKVGSLGPVRANLMNKGMIYSPAYGELAFTVPLFDKFMCRAMPVFESCEEVDAS